MDKYIKFDTDSKKTVASATPENFLLDEKAGNVV